MRHMWKILALPGAALLVLTASSVASASGLHYFQSQEPTFSATADTASPPTATMTASGQIAGAGSSINATLDAPYTFSSTCKNTGNDTGPVPGLSGSGSASGNTGPIKTVHGNASFSVTATASVGKKACPNSDTTTLELDFTSPPTLTITSNNGGTLTCTPSFSVDGTPGDDVYIFDVNSGNCPPS